MIIDKCLSQPTINLITSEGLLSTLTWQSEDGLNTVTNIEHINFIIARGVNVSQAIINAVNADAACPIQDSAFDNGTLVLKDDGVINIGSTVDYETLVLDDDDIPNKKYIDDLFTQTSGTAALRIRRTTSITNVSNTWVDLQFDVTDVELNPAILEHSTNIDDVLIKQDGTYLAVLNIDFFKYMEVRLRRNDTTVIPGSFRQSQANDEGTITATALFSATAGEKITAQIQDNNIGPGNVDPDATLIVYKIDGVAGPQGIPGEAGLNGGSGATGFGIYAWSETDENAVQLEAQGMTVASSAVGIYDYTFNTSTTSANYNVFVQPVYATPNNNAVEVEVYNKTTTGFTVRLNLQDDSSGTGLNFNIRHSVSVLGLASQLTGVTNAIDIAIDNTNLEVVTDPNLQTWIEDADTAFLNARSTGIRFGGNLVELDNINVRILPGAGEILNNSDATNPIYTKVSWVQTDINLTGAATRVVYIYVDTTGTIQTTETAPDLADYRLFIWLWRVSIRLGSISGTTPITQPVQQYGPQIRDIWQALGVIKTGLSISAGGSNLTLQHAAGTVYISGVNFYNSAIEPSDITFNASNPVTFRLVDRNGNQSADRTTLDPTVYDSNGILTSVPGNNSRATIFQWNFFPGGPNHRIFYGQEFYGSVTEAFNALNNGSYNPIVPINYANSIILGWIIVSKSSTNLLDGTQIIVTSSRFGLVGGGTSSSSSANSINLLPSITNNPVSTLNFNASDFIVANGGVGEGLVSLQNKNLYSIIKVSSTGADQTKNYNVTAVTNLALTGTVLNLGTASTNFTNNAGTITCNFDGVIRVVYNVPHFSPGVRTHLKSTIQINNVDASPACYGYIRSGNGDNRATLYGEDILSVTTGSTIRIGIIRGEGSTIASTATIEPRTNIIIERIS